MYHNYQFDTASEALPRLLHDLLQTGDEHTSRAGAVKEMTHVGITLREPWRREILCEGRKPSIAAQIAESMWVISGRDDIGWLENYLPRARDFSDDGFKWRAGYGKRLRGWPFRDGDDKQGGVVDQLRYVVETLSDSSLSRQAVMSIWDPHIDTSPGKDIPCNNWLSFSSRLGKLDLHVAIRSNDAIWGWSGINAFEWSVLQEVVAGILGLEVGGLHFSTTSFHLYDKHWVKADKIRQFQKMTYPLPRLLDSPRFDPKSPSDAMKGLEEFDDLSRQWFHIEKAIRNGDDSASVVEQFPEPMMQSWLRVLQWWWTGEREYLAALEGTNLEAATYASIQPPDRSVETENVADGTGRVVFSCPTSGLRAITPQIIEDPNIPLGTVVLGGTFADPIARRGQRPVDVAKAAVEGKVTVGRGYSEFIEQLCDLHLEKEAAYQGSWKKRGELFSILPNIGRKIDRLSGGETADETSSDTAGDLLVYLAKYDAWLQAQEAGYPDSPTWANEVLKDTEDVTLGRSKPSQADLVASLTSTFEHLLEQAEKKERRRRALVLTMLPQAYQLARMLWENEQDCRDDYRGSDVD